MAWRLPEYEPMNQLGSGSTGAVVMSRDRATGTVVAIKYLSKEVFGLPDFGERFRAEAAVLASIENRHLAQVYEYVEGPDSAAIVMELVDGVSLRQLIGNGIALAPESALYVVKDALLGLAEVHRRGVVHRDVKPENLMVASTGTTKVVDVGIAARFRRSAPAPGNPRYLAPELWLGRPATPASDVYAATATLLECLTGEPPLTTDGKMLGRAGLAADEEIAALLPADLADSVRRLVTRGLAFQPGNRPADASAMLGELESAALRAYGPGWEQVGRSRLLSRIAGTDRTQHVAAVTTPARSARTKHVLVAVGLTIALGAGFLAITHGTLFSGTSAAANPNVGATPVFTHVPIASPGPVVPVPSPTGPNPDTIKPQAPTGLHVTGRSRTAVSLDWNPAQDNDRVVGYIISRGGHRVGTSYLPGYTDIGLAINTKYEFTVTAFDAAGNISPNSSVVFGTTLMARDSAPPSVPAGLHSTGRNTTSIVLAWSPSRDNTGVAGYDVYRDGAHVASVTRPYFRDTKLTAATTHTYAVRAFDTSNNASANSPAIMVRTLTAPDKTPPSVPTGVDAVATSVSTINVTWLASTDNVGVIGYNVYRDHSAKPIATVQAPALSFTDEALAPGTTHWYTVSAFDAAGKESAHSTPAQKATTQDQPPPPPPPVTPPPAPVTTSVKMTIDKTDCSVTIEATVTVTGPMVVSLHYTATGGIDGSKSVTFTDGGSQTVTLNTVVVTSDGSASVTDDVSGLTDSQGWSAPECVPPPPPPPDPDPTVTPDPGDSVSIQDNTGD
jgi:chitodextrinase